MKLEERTTPHLLTFGILTASNENLVRPVLIAELGCITFPGFLISGQPGGSPRQRGRNSYKFDGDLLVVQEVGALKDDTKGAFTDLLAHTVVDTHHIRRRGGHGFGSKDCNPKPWITGNGFRDVDT